MLKSILLALMITESGLNPSAYNEEGRASGLGQITPIAVKEASIQCDLSLRPNLFNPLVNLVYTVCLYSHYLEVGGSQENALVMYHGGYRALRKKRRGLAYGPKTEAYVKKVLKIKKGIENGTIKISTYCNEYRNLPKSICGTTPEND